MAREPASAAYRACVGIMVLDPAGRVWIGRRPDPPTEPAGPGTWWQRPHGGIDAGEDPAQAALRELEEETGMRSVDILAESRTWLTYDLPEHLRPQAWGGRYRGQKQKWFAVRFTGSESEIVTARPPGHQVEFDAWRWAAIGELVDLVVPFKRAVYEEVVREFAPLAAPARRG
jgi:putative (di)nucleoside polyphosphate hydrolase